MEARGTATGSSRGAPVSLHSLARVLSGIGGVL